MQPTYSTPRLHLTPLTPANAEFIIALLNTPGWLAFIGDRNIHTKEDALAYIQRINDNPNVTYWVAYLPDQTATGIITFIKRDYLDHHDIGFAFLPEYSKHGYAYEAAMTVLKDAMNDTPTILATTVPENISSIKLLEKMGFSYQKKIIDDSDELLVYGISADKFSNLVI